MKGGIASSQLFVDNVLFVVILFSIVISQHSSICVHAPVGSMQRIPKGLDEKTESNGRHAQIATRVEA